MARSYPQSRSRNQYMTNYRQKQPPQTYASDFAPPHPGTPAHPHSSHYRPLSQPQQRAHFEQRTVAASAPVPPTGVSHGYRQARPRSQRRGTQRRSPLKAWLTRGGFLAGGGMLALTTLTAGPKPFSDRVANEASEKAVCQEVVQDKSVLSRAELSELLAVAERAPKADVQTVIAEPYCTLSNIEVREGITAQREAYPLEFNPETWFIVLYENGEYAGFDFSFSH